MRPNPLRLTARSTQRIGNGPPPGGTVDRHLQTREHKAWAKLVLQRAAYRCQERLSDGTRCKKMWPPHRMHADHIQERRDRPELALDPSNGVCLCVAHHVQKTHRERAKRMGKST